jgi:hypothetical protein
MSLETSTVQVNFSKPFPVFPLRDVVLLPHALLRLFIFEPRYRQMIEHALDSRGQIAMAVFEGEAWKQEYHDTPAVRPAVCLGQIERHHSEGDGNYRVLLHGVCRARVVEELPPDETHLYRRARLEPVEPTPAQDDELVTERRAVQELIAEAPITELAACTGVLKQIEANELPTSVLFELVTIALLNDKTLQYRLLAEGSAHKRAGVIEHELLRLRSTLIAAKKQLGSHDEDSGVYFN